MTISHLHVSTNHQKPCKQTSASAEHPFSTSPHLKTYLESLHTYLNGTASPKVKAKMGSAKKVAMTHYPKASTDFAAKLPLIANENAFLGDISTRFAPLPARQTI